MLIFFLSVNVRSPFTSAVKISDLIKVCLNWLWQLSWFFHTSWSSQGPWSKTDLKRAADRQLWRETFASWCSCSVILAEPGWWASKDLDYARIFAFTLKLNWYREEHMAVLLIRWGDCSRFRPPPTSGPGPRPSAPNPTQITRNLQYWTSARSLCRTSGLV